MNNRLFVYAQFTQLLFFHYGQFILCLLSIQPPIDRSSARTPVYLDLAEWARFTNTYVESRPSALVLTFSHPKASAE